MASYKCTSCKKVIPSEDVKRKVRCKWCGHKILEKTKSVSTVYEAI